MVSRTIKGPKEILFVLKIFSHCNFCDKFLHTRFSNLTDRCLCLVRHESQNRENDKAGQETGEAVDHGKYYAVPVQKLKEMQNIRTETTENCSIET